MEILPVGIADEAGHRTVVVALDTEVESLRALDWVQDNFHKPGDIVHMVHVCKCMSSPLEVFHGNLSRPSQLSGSLTVNKLSHHCMISIHRQPVMKVQCVNGRCTWDIFACGRSSTSQ